MSERINVDHAFDPEARQAQAELDAYMDARPYQDDKGNVHEPQSGKFANADNYHDGARNDHYDESLAEGDYEGESLDQLAKRVAEARKDGDKTRANDAEEAFMDKFYAYAEKYGWENEVVDDSANNQLAADKNAKVGRDTVDARLERYGKIMYGEAEAENEPAAATNENAPETASEAAEVANDAKEVAESTEEESLLPDLTEEQIDQRLAAVESVKEEMAQDEHAADAEPEYDSEAQRQRMDERLNTRIVTDGLEPVEVPVEDGESLEEYEARAGAIDTAGLEPVGAEAIDTAGLEDVEGEEPEVRRSRRLRDRFSPTALAARLTTANFFRKKNRSERETTEDDSNEHSRKGKVALGLGVLTVAAVGVGVIIANKYGVDYQPGNNGGSGGGHGGLNGGIGGNKGGNGLNWNDFDPSARNVTPGEGWNQTFKEMGIPKSEWNDVLKSAGPKLGKLGEAYYDNGAREWRISDSGPLSKDALRIIAGSSRRNGINL